MPPIIDCSSDSEAEDNTDIVIVAERHEGSAGDHRETGSSQVKQNIPRSWVYDHSEKKEEGGKPYFFCRVELKNGKRCTYKVHTAKGNTSNISNHLKEKHNLKNLLNNIRNFYNYYKSYLLKNYRN